MPSLVSSVYCHDVKLRAVNKQTMSGLSFQNFKAKSDSRPVLEKKKVTKVKTNIHERTPAQVRQLLGDPGNLTVKKVRYRKDGYDCVLMLKISAMWFTMGELIDAGYLGNEWKPYYGEIGENRCKVGLLRVSEKFGLPISDYRRLKYEEARKSLKDLGVCL